ncbi:MAG: hypothetical protein RL748_1335 [Pseudomonadota bacterium]|jgi:polar amino acid transport system substrate-binding protein
MPLFSPRLIILLFLLFAGSAQALTLIGEDDWYPYSAVKDGKLRGFAVDLIRAAYAAVDMPVTFKSAPYARCLKLVQAGLEVGCFDSLKDEKLTRDFLFHQEPIFRAEIGIFALSGVAQTQLKPVHLKGKRVGVTHGYTYTDEVDQDASIRREVAPSDLLNLRKLLMKRSDYALVYTRVVDYLVTRYPEEFKGKIRQVGMVSQDNLYVSFSKVHPDAARYAALLDQGLLKIRRNGQYAKIEEQWRAPAP